METTAIERVEAALASAGCFQRLGGNWTCPAHEDDKPSLSVTSNEHGVAMHCHAGCSIDQIADSLGLTFRDLFTEEVQRTHREVERYLYTDQDGTLLYSKVRYEPKGFAIFHHGANGWEKGIGGSERVLYRLPEVVEGISQGRVIYVVEGEKDADRLVANGQVATCNFDGAGGKWRESYTRQLEGAKIIIIADRDEPGVAHARKIQENLKGHVLSLKIVQSATEGKGHDVSDHLDAGHPLEDLLPLDEAGVTRLYKRVNWRIAFKQEPEDIKWLKEDFLEAGTLNCLFSKPGVGKSLLALEVALEITRSGSRVMYIDDENRTADVVDRMRSFRVEPDDLDNLVMYNFQNLPPLDTEVGGEHLDALAEANEPDLVILDTVSRMIKGGENEADTFIQLYRCSLTRLKKRDIAILRLDHTGKDSTRGQRGSSAKESDADVLWYLTRDSDTLFSLECQKSRSGHIPYGQIINLDRKYEPLRHVWNVQVNMPLSRFEAVMRQMDILGIPTSLGRPAVRKIFKDNNIGACSNEQLSAAITERRNREKNLSAHGWDSRGQQDRCPF